LAIVGQAGATAIEWRCSAASGTTFTDQIGYKYFDSAHQTCAP
jgi:hypothetical protein